MNPMDKRFGRYSLEFLSVLICYSLLAIFYCYPVALKPVEETISLGLNYVLFANSHFIWEQLHEFSSPLEVQRLFYPIGYTIHEGFLPSLMHLLFGGVSSPLLALNLSILFSFVMAGLGAYLLCWHLTGSRFASFIAGIIYAFCPQHLANIGTYPILHIEWIPWFLSGLFRFSQKRNWLWLLLIQSTFIFASLSSWYFSVFLLLSTALWSLFGFVNFRSLTLLGSSFLVSGFLLFPFSPSLLLGDAGTVTGGLSFVVAGSADLISYFIPAWHHWHLGYPIMLIQQDWPGDPSLRANYLGYVPLALAIFGLLLTPRRKIQYFFLALAGSAFILSLGPYLTIWGESEWVIRGGTSTMRIPLPYLWLSDIFPFSTTRAVSRYSILVTLSLAVLSAFAVAGIQQHLSRRRVGIIGCILIGPLVLLELWPAWPMHTRGVVPPSPFYEKLAGDSGDSSILELPFKNNAYRIPYLARVHDKKIIGGAVDKPYHRFATRLRRIPFLRGLTMLGTPLADSRRVEDVFAGPGYAVDVLSAFQVDFAIIHKWDQFVLSFGDYFEPEPQFDAVQKYLTPDSVTAWEDDHLLVLRPKEVRDNWLFPEIGQGWSSVEEHPGYLSRPLLVDRGSLLFHSGARQKVDVSFELAIIYVPDRDIEITLNQEPLFRGEITARVENDRWQKVSFEHLSLNPGVNKLIISTAQPLTSGEEAYGNGDTRQISFLIRNLNLRPSSEAPDL